MQLGQPFLFGASAAFSTGVLILLEAEKVNAEISDEDRAEFYFNRGVSKNKSGDYLGAISDFNKSIEIYPNVFLTYFYRGVAKIEIGDYTSDYLFTIL